MARLIPRRGEVTDEDRRLAADARVAAARFDEAATHAVTTLDDDPAAPARVHWWRRQARYARQAATDLETTGDLFPRLRARRAVREAADVG